MPKAEGSGIKAGSLKNVAVDLTPVLPGGENGGAKIFVLELLQRLAAIMPATRFVLLTRPETYNELAFMDRSNICRLSMDGTAGGMFAVRQAGSFIRRLQNRLPVRITNLLKRVLIRLQRGSARNAGRSLLRSIRADLLFCPFTAPIYHEPGVPIVATLYDLQYKTYPSFFSPEDVAQRDQTFKDACRHATVLAAISEYTRSSAIEHSNLPPEKIRTVYLRMARRLLPEGGADSDTVKRLSLSAQRYLLYPANFWKHKNHEQLLISFGMACQAGLAPDIKLVCTGAPGERQSWLIRAAAAMGLQNRLLFPGYLPDYELEAVMNGALAVVFPSLYEGFGLPVIEAMAAGVPVACSNIRSLPEVVGDAAILFDPRIPTQIMQAILDLAADQGLRMRLIEAGRKRAGLFEDSGIMAQEYRELFEYAVAGRPL